MPFSPPKERTIAGMRAVEHLLDHLIGTADIVRRWTQPRELQYAALIHSVYGTDVYEQPLFALSRRAELAELAGERAERTRLPVLGDTARRALCRHASWARELPARTEPGAMVRRRADRELDALVLLHMANLAEQKTSGDAWLVRLRKLAELLIDSESIRLPLFVAHLAEFSDADEALLQRSYASGLAELGEPGSAMSQLALGAAVCPVVPEPCIWHAYLAHRAGDGVTARDWARQGRRRLDSLGAAWDKRLTYEQWLELTDALETPDARESPLVSDPRALYDAVSSSAAGSARRRSVDFDVDGQRRFHRYVYWLADAGKSAPLGIYPGLDSKPWYDPAEFPLACYLETHFEQIREEILALDPSRFHRESERIRRSGDWDVLFLYERGRRRDEVCDACPVTTRGIEVTRDDEDRSGAHLCVADARRNAHPRSPRSDQPQAPVSPWDRRAVRRLCHPGWDRDTPVE